MKFDVYILHAAELKTSLGCACDGCRSLGGRRKILKRKKEMYQTAVALEALCCAVVSGRDDDRVNWRDSRCPLDVTTATSVLAHASAPLLLF